MRDYHRLEIWRRAHALAIAVHETARGLRGNSFTALRSQLTRAADSVAATIVEGCGASSARDFARFLDMSIKSSSELEAQLQTGNDYGIVHDRDWRSFTDEVRDIRKMTWGLRQKVLGNEAPNPKKPSTPKEPSRSISHGKRKTDNGKRKTPSPEN